MCRAYATEQIARQKADFQRLGVLGDWDHPYTTMAYAQRGRRDPHARQAPGEGLSLPRAEAGQLVLRLPAARSPKPKSNTRTAGHRDRRRLSRSTTPIAAKLARAFGLRALPDGPVAAVIWTTTPWTIPANQALNVHPDFDYALVADADAGC